MSTLKKSEESILNNLTVYADSELETQRWIQARQTINDEFCSILKLENQELAKAQMDLYKKTRGPVYRNSLYFQQQWHQIKLQLNNYIRDIMHCQRYPNLNADKCQLHLRRTLTIHGGIWEWELILPEEVEGGSRSQIHDLTSTNILPCCSIENEEFIRYLADNHIIQQFCKTLRC